MRPIRNRADWDSLSPWETELYLSALEAVALMRSEGLSLEQAARRAGIDEGTVLDFAGEVVHSKGLGTWVAEPEDRLYRRMRILTADGLQVRGVRGSRGASLVGEYWRDVAYWRRTGDGSRLNRYPQPFLTDPAEIFEWWRRGELDFLDIYDTD